MAGRKGRCAKCGEVFRVPALEKQASLKPPAPAKPEPVPQHIPVTCRVCQTLMYGRLDQVGKSIKCPDCGAQSVVPPPTIEKPKKQPAAIEGDQYEVWGADDAPSLAEIIASQPKYIAVECPMCQTLMHGTLEQVGKKLKCPDCGTLCVVPPLKEPVKTPNYASDELELEIDPTLDPGERPMIVPPRRPMLYEEEAETARKRQEERDARGDRRGPRVDVKGRPVMPRYPTATRILSFLFSRGVVARWAALTLTWYVLVSPTWLTSLTPMGPLAAVPMGILSFICLLIWDAALAAIVMSIIVESSTGADEVESWPSTNPVDWAGEFFYLLVACLVSPLPGWLIGRFVPEPAVQVLLFIGSTYFALPVIILSQLEVGSAFGVASPKVIASLLRVPGSWLIFYVEIAVLMLVCGGITIAASLVGPYMVVSLVPMYIAAAVLAARILGRLAWKLSESMPGEDDEDEPAS
jgi:DNA-directed RNA polymerase subunit M/transcription elongation factor TFIIS